jgi:hypothetical protein
MEAIKSRKANIIVLLLTLGFLFLYGCAFAQIERTSHYSSEFKRNITTRFSSYVIELESPLSSKESIVINAKSDSLNNGKITFMLYAYFPKNINPKDAAIVLGYSDGTTDVLPQIVYDKDDNYTEYQLTSGLNNISSKKVEYIVIRGVLKSINKDKTYFKDFISYL